MKKPRNYHTGWFLGLVLSVFWFTASFHDLVVMTLNNDYYYATRRIQFSGIEAGLQIFMHVLTSAISIFVCYKLMKK